MIEKNIYIVVGINLIIFLLIATIFRKAYLCYLSGSASIILTLVYQQNNIPFDIVYWIAWITWIIVIYFYSTYFTKEK